MNITLNLIEVYIFVKNIIQLESLILFLKFSEWHINKKVVVNYNYFYIQLWSLLELEDKNMKLIINDVEVIFLFRLTKIGKHAFNSSTFWLFVNIGIH